MFQESLFTTNELEPLASRMRPESLEDIAGQQHLLGEGKILRRMIASDRLPSMIFWGPPGVGKTTLARVIASQTRSEFINFSAVTSGIKEIKEVMGEAERRRLSGARTIVFVDEIHRFSPTWNRGASSSLAPPPKIPPLRSTRPCSPGARCSC